MRAGGRRGLDAALAQRAHLLDRAAGEHRPGTRRDARAQLRPRPRDDGDDGRPPHAGSPQPVLIRREAGAPLGELETAHDAPPVVRVQAFRRARVAARELRERGGTAALVVERLPARSLGGRHRAAAAQDP